MAKNSLGNSTMTATVEIEETKFTVTTKNSEFNEEEKVEFMSRYSIEIPCHVTPTKETKIQWYFNNRDKLPDDVTVSIFWNKKPFQYVAATCLCN